MGVSGPDSHGRWPPPAISLAPEGNTEWSPSLQILNGRPVVTSATSCSRTRRLYAASRHLTAWECAVRHRAPCTTGTNTRLRAPQDPLHAQKDRRCRVVLRPLQKQPLTRGRRTFTSTAGAHRIVDPSPPSAFTFEATSLRRARPNSCRNHRRTTRWTVGRSSTART